MKNVVVVGSQWGDEGRGKIVDWLSSEADVVVRFQGKHTAQVLVVPVDLPVRTDTGVTCVHMHQYTLMHEARGPTLRTHLRVCLISLSTSNSCALSTPAFWM